MRTEFRGSGVGQDGNEYPSTAEIARCAGRLRGTTLATRDQIRTQADLLIAATAQVHQQTLVTCNSRDFQGCGSALLNPCSSSCYSD